MSTAADASRTWVLSVGIERYDHGSAMDLPGAADAALRFARWALAHQVPPAHILVGCTALEGALVLPPGVVGVGTTRAAIEDTLIDLGARAGDLLLVFWCGHGVLNEDDERALFTSDATGANKRNLLVDDLLAMLGSASFAGFALQVLLIDACANFVADMRFDETLPRTSLPKKAPRETQQFVLFAAAQGQIADYNRTAREGTFSRTVLAWLEEQPESTLPPDVEALTRHVDATFETLRETGQLRQVPVYRRVRFFAGSEDELRLAGGRPVAGELQAAVRASPLTLAQVQRVVDAAVGALEIVPLPPDDPVLGAADPETAAETAAHLVAEGRGDVVVDALQRHAVTEAQRIAALQVRETLRRQLLVAPALLHFGAVTSQQVREAYFRAVPTAAREVPRDLDEALDLAAAFGAPPGGVSPVHRLVADLEHLTGARVPDAWFGLAPDRLNAVRAESATARTGTARLVVDLRDHGAGAGATTWPTEVVGHLLLPDKEWSEPRTVAAEPTPAGAQEAVRRLVDWAYERGVARFTVGFIVPRSLMDAVPESWAYGDALEEPQPLWHHHPTVLHSAERLSTPRAQARWTEMSTAITGRLVTQAPQVLWIEPDQRSDAAAIVSTVRSATAACFGLAFVPGAFAGELRHDPIVALVAAGAPYLLWSERDPEDWEALRDDARGVIVAGRFDAIPERLHALRAAEQEELAAGLRLVWDAPDVLPPLGQLGGL